jgi:uncharacterized protein DUF4019
VRPLLGLSIVVLAGVTLSAARAAAQMDSPLQEDKAQRVAEAWLGLVDKGDYDASWSEASTAFQRKVSRERWRQEAARLRDPRGHLVSRTFSSRQYNERLPGAPPGQYVVLSYRSDFQTRKDVGEIVTASYDGLRGWRVAGYRIQVFTR